VIVVLDAAFPGGYYGGALPDRGFWGRTGDPAPVEAWFRARGSSR